MADPVLETSRLVLRPMVMDDAEAMHAFKSDPVATRCYAQDPFVDEELTRGWVRAGLEGRKSGTSITWAITLRQDGQVTGECCLWNIDQDSKHAELGYELLRSHWKRGLMAEALNAVLEHGFNEMRLNRVEANPLSINLASQKVLLGLGFRREGTLRQRHFFRGEYYDELWFGLLREEWEMRGNGDWTADPNARS
jgi:RimJ/RimL family protein N-acetyltransferase